MEPKDLPIPIAEKVRAWLGAHAVRYFWQFDETFVVLAQCAGTGHLYCLRVFPVGESLELSQDNVIYV